MADLVEDRAPQQVLTLHIASSDIPIQRAPGEPVADLRVGWKQQHVAVGKFDCDCKTSVVRDSIKLKRELTRISERRVSDIAPSIISRTGPVMRLKKFPSP